jgi:hypothetical protein
MSILQPKITSILNGTLTIGVDDISLVSAVFNQILIFRATNASGPFTQLTPAISLTSALVYTFTDASGGPQFYYKAQFFNSSTLVTSTFSELAQETGVFSEYTIPTSTATYPPEIALSGNDREIVESIRITLGDLGSVERDYYDATNTQSRFECSAQVSADQKTWELTEPKGWPRDVIINGITKTSINDPLVKGYRFLTFTGSGACITGTLDIFYDHFRFSDREILLAYDRSANLLVSCGLTTTQITTEMRIMQAAILILEGEIRDIQQSAIRIRDGDTEYDNTTVIRGRTEDLSDLKRKMREIIECARINAAYDLEGVRID